MAECSETRHSKSSEESNSVTGRKSEPISPESDLDVGNLFNINAEREPGKSETDFHEVVEPEVTRTIVNKNLTSPGQICKTPQTPIPDVEPQEQLLWTLKHKRYDEFVNLLKNPEVNAKFKYTRPPHTDYGTCIEIASRLPDRGMFVKALLEHGVKPNVQEIHPEPIHYAAKDGNPDVLRVLLQDKRTKINALDSSDRTALHHAVKYSKKDREEKYKECITLLLGCSDLDINKPNKKGYTAIHEAANSRKEAVELFLKYRQYDLDLDTYRANGRTAREFILNKYPELRSILPDVKLYKQSSDINTQLLWSLQHRKLKEFTDILQQVDKDGNARVDPNFCYGEPHYATCLEIASKEDDCAEFVKQLLKAGADPNTSSRATKQTPLHSAAELGNHRVLSILLEDRRTNVNAVDIDGKTVLHIIAQNDQDTTEKKNVLKCLELILQKRKLKRDKIAINVNLLDNFGQTAAQIALERGNKEVLEKMLYYARDRIDFEVILKPHNEKLSDAIQKKFPHLERKIFIRRDISHDDLSTNLFQLLYNNKSQEFVNMLKNTEDIKEIIDVDDGNYTLLQYAARQGANPAKTTDYEKRPPLIIASVRKNHEVLRILLEMSHGGNLDINSVDSKGNTALHYASKNGDLECVVNLMSHGANFRYKNVFDKPPLPANSVKCFLDNSLKTNNKYPEDEEYELIFDYTFLLAHRKQNVDPYPPYEEIQPFLPDPEVNNTKVLPLNTFSPEMDFLFYISTSKEHRHLMEHPIVTSFLRMKWQRVKMVFCINLIIYALFVSLLNAFIILDSKKDDANQNMVSEDFLKVFDPIARICLLMFIIYFTIREICQLILSPIIYVTNFENALDLGLIFFTAWMLSVSHMSTYLVIIVILLSWSELILLTGRLPKLSKNIEMLKTVSKNYCWFLFSYIFLIIAFAFSFYRLLHKSAEDEVRHSNGTNMTEKEGKNGFYMTPWLAILKTFVMMMGEFEASNFLPHLRNSENAVTCFWLFSLFVFLIAMVLLNLLTGLAVSDTQTIKANARQLCIISRIRLIHEIEKNVLQWQRIGEKYKSYKMIRPFLCLHTTFFRNICLFPENIVINKQVHILPNKGPEIIFNDGKNSKCSMKLEILRRSVEIISNKGKEDDVFSMKQTLENVQEATSESHNKVLARLSSIDEKLKQSESDKEELKEILKNITSLLSKINTK
ncbi:hypothetical protein L9F63_019878 [Diploptera punctata]|uniref:Ion transport domain-containing protein n=1 Tax=Diploptera punctata TaxID=6984 RepID=A0AAD7ZVA0_DIPPU|nr:hypothetical protein L9F63_019878 [Diploptera punctata]